MKNEKFFQIFKKDKETNARVGKINTSHGKILTPAFVPVGSQATVKSLTSKDLKEIGVQVFFVNTYHLYLRPGAEVIKKLGGLHKFMGWAGPIMTDSGGFQVFSLGRVDALRSPAEGSTGGSIRSLANHRRQMEHFTVKDESSAGGGLQDSRRSRTPAPVSLVKIDFDGVTFRSHLDGSKHRFTPEKSIEIQEKLGGDMMIAFDECAPYPVSHKYAQMAMKRTHRWTLRSLAAAQGKPGKEALFGVVQGSVFKDLREESAKFISSLPFAGIAIGGVSVGESKSQMRQVLDWVMPILPKEKPVHLLGVGEIDDVFAAVEKGVDMMDCVMPTRLGRMGHVLINTNNTNFKFPMTNDKWRMDITKSLFVDDPSPIDGECRCFVCRNFSRAYICHLFRSRELLAYRLASFHNLYFMERLFEKIRRAIKKGEFLRLKKQWLKE